jgi:hypothetical protein
MTGLASVTHVPTGRTAETNTVREPHSFLGTIAKVSLAIIGAFVLISCFANYPLTTTLCLVAIILLCICNDDARVLSRDFTEYVFLDPLGLNYNNSFPYVRRRIIYVRPPVIETPQVVHHVVHHTPRRPAYTPGIFQRMLGVRQMVPHEANPASSMEERHPVGGRTAPTTRSHRRTPSIGSRREIYPDHIEIPVSAEPQQPFAPSPVMSRRERAGVGRRDSHSTLQRESEPSRALPSVSVRPDTPAYTPPARTVAFLSPPEADTNARHAVGRGGRRG